MPWYYSPMRSATLALHLRTYIPNLDLRAFCFIDNAWINKWCMLDVNNIQCYYIWSRLTCFCLIVYYCMSIKIGGLFIVLQLTPSSQDISARVITICVIIETSCHLPCTERYFIPRKYNRALIFTDYLMTEMLVLGNFNNY